MHLELEDYWYGLGLVIDVNSEGFGSAIGTECKIIRVDLRS